MPAPMTATVALACSVTPVSLARVSVGRDAGLADHSAPHRDVALDALAELGGRAADRLGAEVAEFLLDVGLPHDAGDLAAQALDDLGRRAERRQQGAPG